MKKIFISYANQQPDAGTALDFFQFFQNNGLDPFISNTSILIGERWSERIMKELAECDYFFILLSAHSLMSDMVTEELKRAKELFNRQAKPIIFPIRLKLGYDETFNYEISGYLNRVQQKLWLSDEDTPKIGNEILQIIQNKRDNLIETDTTPDLQASGYHLLPPPNAPIEVPGGIVSLNSPYYIVRDGEEKFVQQILWTGALLKIKGPRKFGKTSMLSRVLRFASNNDHRIVMLSMQRMNGDTLRNLSNLLMQLCHYVSTSLKFPSKVKEYWADDWIDIKFRCITYFEDEILSKLDKPMVLALDEVDLIFDYPDVSNEFFSLLRVFHEESKVNDLWNNLKLVITHSSDGNLAVTNLNQSPFNVGLELSLSEFTKDQIKSLADRHQIEISDEQIDDLIENIGAHPYIVRKALYDLQTEKYTFENLKSASTADDGPFADHLQRQYWKLSQNTRAYDAYKRLLKSQAVEDELILSTLRASGLVKGYGLNAVPSFKLYANYFSSKL